MSTDTGSAIFVQKQTRKVWNHLRINGGFISDDAFTNHLLLLERTRQNVSSVDQPVVKVEQQSYRVSYVDFDDVISREDVILDDGEEASDVIKRNGAVSQRIVISPLFDSVAENEITITAVGGSANGSVPSVKIGNENKIPVRPKMNSRTKAKLKFDPRFVHRKIVNGKTVGFFRTQSEKEETEDMTIKCSECSLEFNTMRLLVLHTESDHSDMTSQTEVVLDCHFCDKQFRLVNSMEKHVRQAHLQQYAQLSAELKKRCKGGKRLVVKKGETIIGEPMRDYICEFCGRVFDRKLALSSHRDQAHYNRNEPVTCLYCGAIFENKLQRRIHCRQAHVGENSKSKILGFKKYMCEVCSRTFAVKRDMERHKVTHTDQRPYSCDICGRKYRFANTVQQHKTRAHCEDRNHSCTICGKAFKLSLQLRNHMSVHLDHNPFKCTLCDKTFKRRDYLTQHVKVHKNLERGSQDLTDMVIVTSRGASGETMVKLHSTKLEERDLFDNAVDDQDINMDSVLLVGDAPSEQLFDSS